MENMENSAYFENKSKSVSLQEALKKIIDLHIKMEEDCQKSSPKDAYYARLYEKNNSFYYRADGVVMVCMKKWGEK